MTPLFHSVEVARPRSYVLFLIHSWLHVLIPATLMKLDTEQCQWYDVATKVLKIMVTIVNVWHSWVPYRLVNVLECEFPIIMPHKVDSQFIASTFPTFQVVSRSQPLTPQQLPVSIVVDSSILSSVTFALDGLIGVFLFFMAARRYMHVEWEKSHFEYACMHGFSYSIISSEYQTTANVPIYFKAGPSILSYWSFVYYRVVCRPW